MQARTKEIATKSLNLRPTEIWKMISDEMDKKSKTWKGLTDCQVKNLVKNTRARLRGCDVFRELGKPPLSMVQDSSHFFL